MLAGERLDIERRGASFSWKIPYTEERTRFCLGDPKPNDLFAFLIDKWAWEWEGWEKGEIEDRLTKTKHYKATRVCQLTKK